MKNDRGSLASFLMSPSSKNSNPEHTSQLELLKDPNTKRVKDLLIRETIPVTLCNSLLTYPLTDKKCKLKGDLLKMTT